MGLKRLIKKGFVGSAGSLIEAHIADAIKKKFKTGRTFRECLEESINETIQEDMPGVSHLYQKGRRDGRCQGTIEQTKRDEKKFRDLKEKHDEERTEWKKIDKEKDDLIDQMGKGL